MKQISSLELSYILKELEILSDSRIDNVYNSGKSEFVFQFYKSNLGKFALKIILGKALYMSNIKEIDETPSGFCATLRKHLSGKFLSGIDQIRPERILELVFSSKGETKKLYMEFFGNGNVVLCNSSDDIIAALYYHKFKDRSVIPKAKYVYPKMRYNMFEISQNDLYDLLVNSKREKIVTSLATELGLGGIYSEEICLISRVDKNKNPTEVNDNDIKLIFHSIKNLISKKIASEAIFLNDSIVDAVPFELNLYNNLEKKSFDKFSEALEFYYENTKPIKKSEHEQKLEKLKRIIEEQTKVVEQLRLDEKENREKAELIYHNYQLINGIIAEINDAAKKYSWKEIGKRLNGHKVVKEINLKEKSVVIEI